MQHYHHSSKEEEAFRIILRPHGGSTRIGQEADGWGETWARAFIMVSVKETGEVF